MTKMLRRINPTESQIQCAIVDWANNTRFLDVRRLSKDYIKSQYEIIGDYLLAIPNGGFRNKIEAKRLKKEGVKPGVSDLFLAIPTAREDKKKNIYNFGGLWIEVKRQGGKLTTSQIVWIAEMTGKYFCMVVYSADEGIQAIKDYLGMK